MDRGIGWKALAACMLLWGLGPWEPARARDVATADDVDRLLKTTPVAPWDLANIASPLPSRPEPLIGPPPPEPLEPTRGEERHASFGDRVGAVKWEVAGVAAFITATQTTVLAKGARSFRFKDEGWFGKSTANLGVDKLAHAFNAYLIAEFLQARINRKIPDAGGSAVTAAILATGLMAYGELYDAHKESSGFSYQDVTFNLAGAGFSVLRNSVPGLKEKLDFRLLVMPNSDVYTFRGKRHFEQQRYLFALQFSGFEAFQQSPLRFLELHAGYRAEGFTARDRARGEPLQRKIFLGLGLNLQELFFKSPQSKIGRLAGRTLDYIQVPYTAAHWD